MSESKSKRRGVNRREFVAGAAAAATLSAFSEVEVQVGTNGAFFRERVTSGSLGIQISIRYIV